MGLGFGEMGGDAECRVSGEVEWFDDVRGKGQARVARGFGRGSGERWLGMLRSR